MIGTDLDHFQIVTKTMDGERAADEQTFESLAILNDRLEMLRKLGGNFEKITFSDNVKELARKNNAVAIC